MNECISSWKSNKPGLVILTKSTRDVLSPLTIVPSALPRSLRPIWRHDRIFFSNLRTLFTSCHACQIHKRFVYHIRPSQSAQRQMTKDNKSCQVLTIEELGFHGATLRRIQTSIGLRFSCKPRRETLKKLSETRVLPTPTSVLRSKSTLQLITG